MENNLAPTKKELVDLFFRSLWTFIATGLGALSAAGLGWADLDALSAAAVAAVGAVFTVISVYSRQKLSGTIQQAETFVE